MPFTCQDPGPVWPDVARRVPALAANLAPSKLISSANDPKARTKGRPGRQPALGHHGPWLTTARGEDPPSDDVRDSAGAARPDPARASTALPCVGCDRRR